MADQRRVPLWIWWIPVVWAISAPVVGFTAHPQWHRIHWVPFTDPADKPLDLIANIALFVPFGYSLAQYRLGRFRVVAALLAAAAVSVSAEATQLLSTKRYPSATDVVAALAGTLAGAALRERGRERDQISQTL